MAGDVAAVVSRPWWWMLAGTPIRVPYPCGCDNHFDAPVSKFCGCVGRRDLDVVPRWCCAARLAARARPRAA
jgi:hypothetical protein